MILDCKKPFLLHGTVVTGFGRGSTELGFPTANVQFKSKEGKALADGLEQGVYYGFVVVGHEPEKVYMMAMSVGDNPHYGNEERTVEVHLLDYRGPDFYGSTVTCIVGGYIRPMTKFDSLDALVAAITDDCRIAREKLTSNSFKSHPFLLSACDNPDNLPIIM